MCRARPVRKTKNEVTSLQNASSLQSSPSRHKENRQLSVCKTKVTSHLKEPQFSGSCENKSDQMLRLKVRLIGTGWKMKKEPKTNLYMKESSRKSHRFKKSSSRKKLIRISSQSSTSKKPSSESLHYAKVPSRETSWKKRKKKSSLDRSSILKETVSWKRRKKKTSPKFVPELQSSHLKRNRTWKQKKKLRHHSKFFFDICDWNPGIN